jgi:hypothetical protein
MTGDFGLSKRHSGQTTDSANAVSLDIYNRSFAGKPVPGDQQRMSKDLPSLITAVYLTGHGGIESLRFREHVAPA